VVIDGKLIEEPVLRDRHRIVAIAERIGAECPNGIVFNVAVYLSR
jgi:hypothetical protein